MKVHSSVYTGYSLPYSNQETRRDIIKREDSIKPFAQPTRIVRRLAVEWQSEQPPRARRNLRRRAVKKIVLARKPINTGDPGRCRRKRRTRSKAARALPPVWKCVCAGACQRSRARKIRGSPRARAGQWNQPRGERTRQTSGIQIRSAERPDDGPASADLSRRPECREAAGPIGTVLGLTEGGWGKGVVANWRGGSLLWN